MTIALDGEHNEKIAIGAVADHIGEKVEIIENGS
jgi:hypothetical protein